MRAWREEFFVGMLVLVLVLGLDSIQPVDPGGRIERMMPFTVESVRKLRVESALGTRQWVRPEIGWLEAEDEAFGVFRALWELSRLRADLPEAEPTAVVRTLHVTLPDRTAVVEIGRLRGLHRMPVRIDGGPWRQASGDLWDALEVLLRPRDR